MTPDRVVVVSGSAAMDGGLVGIADVAGVIGDVGLAGEHRLVGGTAVMLHSVRSGLDLALRMTADADFGVTPYVLGRRGLVDAIEALGYVKVAGNRWERRVDDRRIAAVDLLVPAYRSRARDTVRVGSVVTTEVPGLAEAFRRPGVQVTVAMTLTTGEVLDAEVTLPDAVGMVALKALARTVRDEDRDVEDLWRCLEIAAAQGVQPGDFDVDEALGLVRRTLWRQLGPGGTALDVLTHPMQQDAAARLRTRIHALLTETVGRPDPHR